MSAANVLGLHNIVPWIWIAGFIIVIGIIVFPVPTIKERLHDKKLMTGMVKVGACFFFIPLILKLLFPIDYELMATMNDVQQQYLKKTIPNVYVFGGKDKLENLVNYGISYRFVHTDADFEDVITDEPNKIKDYYMECFNVLGWRKEKIREKELIEFEYSELEKHSQGLTQEQKNNFSVSCYVTIPKDEYEKKSRGNKYQISFLGRFTSEGMDMVEQEAREILEERRKIKGKKKVSL